jgi:hypothetical protein
MSLVHGQPWASLEATRSRQHDPAGAGRSPRDSQAGALPRLHAHGAADARARDRGQHRALQRAARGDAEAAPLRGARCALLGLVAAHFDRSLSLLAAGVLRLPGQERHARVAQRLRELDREPARRRRDRADSRPARVGRLLRDAGRPGGARAHAASGRRRPGPREGRRLVPPALAAPLRRRPRRRGAGPPPERGVVRGRRRPPPRLHVPDPGRRPRNPPGTRPGPVAPQPGVVQLRPGDRARAPWRRRRADHGRPRRDRNPPAAGVPRDLRPEEGRAGRALRRGAHAQLQRRTSSFRTARPTAA